MAIHDIVYLGDPALRTEAAEVTVFDDNLRALVRDMFETMYHADGIGLAAPQIGLSTRVIVVDLRRQDEDDPEPQRIAIVNPVVTWESKEVEKQTEGCLSIPGAGRGRSAARPGSGRGPGSRRQRHRHRGG